MSGRENQLPPVKWAEIWTDVARQLRAHRAAGRGHVLTEDSVRLCTILALQNASVSPQAVQIEVFDPVLKGGKVDLVVSDPMGRTVLELKYPRGSPTGISPDTMTFGELLRDFLRVALFPAEDRWVVMVLGPGLRRYISRNSAGWWVEQPNQTLTLKRSDLEALPKTARDAIGPLEWMLPVSATCVTAEPIDVDLALFAYQVHRPDTDLIAAPLIAREVSAYTTSSDSPAARPRTTTARAEILATIKTLVARSGHPEVTVQDVVDEMRRLGRTYAESTIRTMMTSHMCAQAHGPNIAIYDDLDRVDRGTYRLRTT